MMPTSNEWQYFRPNESDMSIHGMERMLDNGTAIDVVAYGTLECPGEFSWMIRLWDDAAGGYSVHASYDNDIYFSDIESAYDDLVGVLTRQYPHLVERDEIAHSPRRAKNKFMAALVSVGLAASLAMSCLTGCAGTVANASEFSDVPLGVTTTQVSYSQLIDDATFAEGYEACVQIMASGQVGTEENLHQSEGWYDGDFEYEDLDIKMLNYACYDNPLYSMYKTGADDGIGMSIEIYSGDVRVYSQATQQGDDFLSMYSQVDSIARDIDARAVEEANGSTADYVRSVMAQVAEGVAYSYDDASSTHCNDIYGALVNGKSRCYGYATAVKYVLDMRGITNFIATGNCGNERHAWNMVQIGGTWLVVDATMSSTMMKNENVSSLDDCNAPYAYCLQTLDSLNKNVFNRYAPDSETQALMGM